MPALMSQEFITKEGSGGPSEGGNSRPKNLKAFTKAFRRPSRSEGLRPSGEHWKLHRCLYTSISTSSECICRIHLYSLSRPLQRLFLPLQIHDTTPLLLALLPSTRALCSRFRRPPSNFSAVERDTFRVPSPFGLLHPHSSHKRLRYPTCAMPLRLMPLRAMSTAIIAVSASLYAAPNGLLPLLSPTTPICSPARGPWLDGTQRAGYLSHRRPHGAYLRIFEHSCPEGVLTGLEGSRSDGTRSWVEFGMKYCSMGLTMDPTTVHPSDSPKDHLPTGLEVIVAS
ncbi:hypothetical protein DFH09DRAFT_1418446 [Mycena vulgaris]|nr:hypothetical protein DFH09DRAFT_1418446 [Mycena vulgaris]